MNHFEPTPAPLQEFGWITLLRVVAISTIIGVLLALMNGSYATLVDTLLVSNAFGLGIWTFTRALLWIGRGRIGVVPALVVAAPLGVLVGGKAATLLGAYDVVGHWVHDPVHEWKSISLSLLLVISATVFIVVSQRSNEYRLELESERRRRAEASRSQAVAELALLQAQIEPHFLFNTLAHVQSAIDRDPALGKTVLEHLIRYLRATLRRTRRAVYTLGEEREVIEALLAIAAIRLGSRLKFEVNLAEDVCDIGLPPLLLQPLVENAIKHGIEPAMEGGEIRVSGARDDGMLVMRVSDTGVGIAADAPEGVGLSNVRARLASLYEGRGRLTLNRNSPHGVIVELRIPLQRAA